MGWIGIIDGSEGRFSFDGFGHDIGFRPIPRDTEWLTRGTFVLETRVSPDAGPQELFGFDRTHPYDRTFCISALPGGGVTIVLRSKHEVTHTSIQLPATDRTDVIRISFMWDTTQGWAQLCMERPENDLVLLQTLENPLPFLLDDWRETVLGRDRHMAQDVVFAALSTRIEPVGPMPSLAADTPLLSPSGYRPISQIGRGDPLISIQNARVPILHKISRTVPARGSFAPIKLRAPYLGLTSDIIVSPDQRLILSGTDVEYVFGREAVLVPARHLVDGRVASYVNTGSLMTYHQLVMPKHDVLDAVGCAIESQYVGRLRRDSDKLAASLLSAFKRDTLPEHGHRIAQELRPFEAITLIDARAA